MLGTRGPARAVRLETAAASRCGKEKGTWKLGEGKEKGLGRRRDWEGLGRRRDWEGDADVVIEEKRIATAAETAVLTCQDDDGHDDGHYLSRMAAAAAACDA